MAQGLLGGMTSYEVQSLQDILSDIECWLQYASETKSFLTQNMQTAIRSRFWYKVGAEFQMEIEESIIYIGTLLHDMGMVKKAIEDDTVTEREVQLLSSIGWKSVEFNGNYGKTYHNGYMWQDHGNPDFEVVEEMYKVGRDFFVTLQDAGNAAYRLQDYITRSTIVKEQNNITFSGHIDHSQIQIDTNNSTQQMSMDTHFSYEEVGKVIDEIEHYLSDEKLVDKFGETLSQIKNVVGDTKQYVEQRSEPCLIKRNLQTIYDLAMGVSGSLIATGICELIKVFL